MGLQVTNKERDGLSSSALNFHLKDLRLLALAVDCALKLRLTKSETNHQVCFEVSESNGFKIQLLRDVNDRFQIRKMWNPTIAKEFAKKIKAGGSDIDITVDEWL